MRVRKLMFILLIMSMDVFVTKLGSLSEILPRLKKWSLQCYILFT